jgi:hypothetical protein
VHFAVGSATHAHPLRAASGAVLEAPDDSRSSQASAPQAEICSICSVLATGVAVCSSRAPDVGEARASLPATRVVRGAAAPLWASAASRAPPFALSPVH